jgi:hypothetical protein
MIGFPVGLLYANAGEWLIHKYLLHGAGRRRESFWSFHFHEHHRASRGHEMVDSDYERPVFGQHAQGKEALGLLGVCAIHAPLLAVAPFFTGAVWCSAGLYYVRHRRAHLDSSWAREHLAWHYDHHMGPNQDANWCVTWPLFDHVMGTRVRYKGTPREARDRARRVARQTRSTAA